MLQFIFEPRITSSRRQVVKDKIETITKKKKKWEYKKRTNGPREKEN